MIFMSPEENSTPDVGMFKALSKHRGLKRELRGITKRLLELRHEEEEIILEIGGAALEEGIEATGFAEAVEARKSTTAAETALSGHATAIEGLRAEREVLAGRHAEALAPIAGKREALAKAAKEAKKKLSDLQSQLKAIETEISKARGGIEKSKETIAKGESEIPSLEAKIAELEKSLPGLEKGDV